MALLWGGNTIIDRLTQRVPLSDLAEGVENVADNLRSGGMPRELQSPQRHVVRSKPAHSTEQAAGRSTTTPTGKAEGAIVDHDGKVKELRCDGDVLCGLFGGLRDRLAQDMSPSRALTQQHQNRPHTGNSWCEIDVGIKVLWGTQPTCEIMQSHIESVHPLTQFSAKSIKI